MPAASPLKTPAQIIDELWRRQHSQSAEACENEIRGLVIDAIEVDRQQISKALARPDTVPGFRPFPLATVDALIDAYAEWDGEVDVFVDAWNNYTAGLDLPCPEHPSGIHSTYLVDDGSCDFCGDKNRD